MKRGRDALLGGVPDRLRKSPLAGLARYALEVRLRSYALWEGLANRRGDSFHCEMLVEEVDRIEAECRLEPGTYTIAISQGMADMIERLALALTELIEIDKAGAVVLRPDGNGEAAHSRDDLQLAAYLIAAAIGFVADHEFVHAANGHVLLVAGGPRQRGVLDVGEADLRRALELEADRSALFCLVDDVLARRAGTNDLIDRLAVPMQITLAALAVGLLCAFWVAAEGDEEPDVFHPIGDTRIFMLLGPSPVRALERGGFSAIEVVTVQQVLGRLLVGLGERSLRLAPLAKAFSAETEARHQSENLRLEAIYRQAVASFLGDLHFVPPGGRR